MAWDEKVCANTPAPEFEIPEDKIFRENMLEKMGYHEIPISITGENGNTVTAYVAGRIEGE